MNNRARGTFGCPRTIGARRVLPQRVTAVDEQVARVMWLIAQQPTAPVDGDGFVGMLQRLCGAAVRALAASGVAIGVLADDGARGVTTASDRASERIDELQFILGEGPCIDAFGARRPVLVPDLADGAMNRWPVYASTAIDSGVRAVFAFPLQIGAARLGILEVFRARPGPLSGEELKQALTFADVAVTLLLDGQANALADAAAEGLDEAVHSTAELFQAQGMIMVQLSVGLTEALARIRVHAYAEDRGLNEVARDIVAGRLRFKVDRQ
jgi:hypothetical protein